MQTDKLRVSKGMGGIFGNAVFGVRSTCLQNIGERNGKHQHGDDHHHHHQCIRSLKVLRSIYSMENLGKRLISVKNHKLFHTHTQLSRKKMSLSVSSILQNKFFRLFLLVFKRMGKCQNILNYHFRRCY